MKKSRWRILFYFVIVLNIIALASIIFKLIKPQSSVYRCGQAVQCSQCKNGSRSCRYYEDDGITLAKDSIDCECEETDEK